MSKLPATYDALVEAAEQLALYEKLIEQINKDFLLANIDLDFDSNILPSSLKYLLHEVVYNLIQEKFAEYLNLLYIVDVSEAKIKALDGSDTLKLSEQVTFLILQREWQKVWFKQHFRD
ncbi:hypothetical protein [Psychroserpens sp.]|uniref:hypothetical protein n=1 Tax=Psychroserpens sp. TaxID=2020870 RepID=UPI001B2B0038|nr:hypothetical protein [Psychroserpens sp.]MBO6607777.1 hypothetical protein [Psychroserpens sp.]MBO6630327.1 hypothetical protein [Psychroserpens sp.]MBO6654768.1 hypothetical protein [Psychroserpens sp.]MBO6682808.1 hypothetical protein [Psychroserpens sp.]MBO6751135.1 hypothetical protein [Psychroserpens sp.]